MSSDNGLDYSEVSRLGLMLKVAKNKAPQRLDNWLHGVVGPDLLETMKDKAPVDTGYLKEHIVMITAPGEVRVGTQGVPYIAYVVKGTKPHTIQAKDGGTLVFRVGGKTVFAKRVQHPGTQPNTFMQDAAREVMRRHLRELTGLRFDLKSNG